MKTAEEIIRETKERNKSSILETERFLKEFREAKDFATTSHLVVEFIDSLKIEGHVDETDLLQIAALGLQQKGKTEEEGQQLFAKAWEHVS